MESILATAQAKIFGTPGGWSLEPSVDEGSAVAIDCRVRLEIQGTDEDGYILIMSPDGFFTADCWFQTRQEALESAQEEFGVLASSWVVQAEACHGQCKSGP